MILNLKKLNEHVAYHHFKMDSLSTVIKLVSRDCYMASVDLKDAYYSVPIAVHHQKYLKFFWKDNLYCYQALPNGLACAPRLFTKLCKPIYSRLRKMGHTIVGYIDDSLLVADSFESCQTSVNETLRLFESLGFVIHEQKSVLLPSKSVVFLGFEINSREMSIRLTNEKATRVKNKCLRLMNSREVSIRELAQVIGVLVSSFPGVEYGQMHYRSLERLNSFAPTPGISRVPRYTSPGPHPGYPGPAPLFVESSITQDTMISSSTKR